MESEKTKFRTAYGPKERQTIVFNDPSLAKQAMRDECDINNIVKRFEKTGVIEHVNSVQGQYGDFVAVQTYQESLNQVLAAQEAFMSLPSSIRARFENDPEKFFEFATNEANTDELIQMGLVEPPEAVQEPEEDAVASVLPNERQEPSETPAEA